MGIFFCKEPIGFYDSDIHGKAIPKNAIKISAEQYRAVLAAQSNGKVIIANSMGYPVAVDVAEPTTDRLARDARNKRDNLLRECDWSVLPDVPIAEMAKSAWVAYRKALRDVPKQPGFPAKVNWPAAP